VKAKRGLEGDFDWAPDGMHPWFERELEQLAHEEARQQATRPVYRRIDSVAGEVEAPSNYFYATWNEADEAVPTGEAQRVVILGSGPNRIGQGVEFDYCCVHAVQTYRELGYEAVMINCNPETVSTDYDTSNRLYFEPLDEAAVLAVLEREQPVGVVIQFGGQTPLKLARAIEAAGFHILGTPFDAVDLAEDRERFGKLLWDLGIRCPDWGIARSGTEAAAIAHRIGYPVLVRASYVLGGRAMRVCHRANQVVEAFHGVQGATLVDRFLERAIEIDVDALCDGDQMVIGGVMQHVEEAGVHSGDSACVIPAMSLGPEMLAQVEAATERLALSLGVIGLINIQYAVHGDDDELQTYVHGHVFSDYSGRFVARQRVHASKPATRWTICQRQL